MLAEEEKHAAKETYQITHTKKFLMTIASNIHQYCSNN
jgi:hypothetical protein